MSGRGEASYGVATFAVVGLIADLCSRGLSREDAVEVLEEIDRRRRLHSIGSNVIPPHGDDGSRTPAHRKVARGDNPRTRVRAALDASPGELMCARDLIDARKEHGDLRDGDAWGPWRWDEEHLVLSYRGPGYRRHPYEVDVEQILRADDPDAEAWDWIRHVAGKGWDPPAVRCLVFALSRVLRHADASGAGP